VVGKEKCPEKIAELLNNYCNNNLFSPIEADIVDKDVYTILFRGIASCDQSAWTLGTFAGKLGIDNRMVVTYTPQGISGHVVSELFIDKKWRFFDPTFGFIIRNPSGEIVSYDDICNDLSLLYSSPSMLMLKKIEPDKYQPFNDSLPIYIFNKNTKAGFWGNPERGKDSKRRIITKVLDFYIGLFGKSFCYLYQDLYLEYSLFSNTKREDVYNRARNYDLFKRYRPAIDKYKNLIDNYPKGDYTENALFFLGITYHKINDPESSISTLQTLLRQYPWSKWRRMALYYLGLNYELLHDLASAKDCYWRAIDMFREVYKVICTPGEFKVVRRLYDISSSGNP
jgi:hypothetical protein